MNVQNPTQTAPEPDSCTLCLSRCPECHFGDLIKIAYGYLTPYTEWEQVLGTIDWGGCMPAGSNMHRCNLCGAQVGDYFAPWLLSRPQKIVSDLDALPTSNQAAQADQRPEDTQKLPGA